jgi:hypothetical protein
MRVSEQNINSDSLNKQCRWLQDQINYNVRAAINWRILSARISGSARIQDPEDVAKGQVCSSFVASALSAASRGKIEIQHSVILPGDFVVSDQFNLLDIQWYRSPRG